MKQFKINLAKLLKDYKSGWIGVSSDHKKVVVWGKTLKQAIKKAEGIQDRVYYFPAGESYSNYIG